jgi:hypothetical protein
VLCHCWLWHPGHAVHVSDGKHHNHSSKGTRWKTKRNFGAIVPNNGGDEIFCRITDIKDGDCYKECDPHFYEIGRAKNRQSSNKYRAVNVTGGHYTFIMLDGPSTSLSPPTVRVATTTAVKNEHAIGSRCR